MIGLEHATVIAKIAATGTPARRAAAQSSGGQRALVALASRVAAGTFKISADRWALILAYHHHEVHGCHLTITRRSISEPLTGNGQGTVG